MAATRRSLAGGPQLEAIASWTLLVCLLLFLSTNFSGSQSSLANAATTNPNQPHKRLELAGSSSSGGGGGGQTGSSSRQNYFGTLIGQLSSATGQVTGDVYAVDEQTLFIRNFNYDGQAPDAYFWSSTSQQARPSQLEGFIVPDEKGSTKPLERYANKDIVLRLPEGKTLREIPWLSIWSRQLRLSVGEILIPRRDLAIPRPLEVAPLSQLAHGLKSGSVTIVDAQTLLLADFHYDGLGPDAYFWLTRGSSGLSGQNSLKLRDENGLSAPLKKYQGETIVISLPDEFTIYDFDFFGVWCKQFSANFGQTRLPGPAALQDKQPLARVPPSPKMLGIKPENKLNCEILYDDLGFEIRWVLDGDDIVMQLVGKIEPGEYMAFGLGKDDSKSEMTNADAVVAWVERATGQVHATDYFLGSSKQQCVNDPKAGSCPDVKLANGSDSLTLLHGAIVNGYSMVTFKRPQLGVDELYDQHVYSDGQQSVIWAIGVLNSRQEIGYHRLRTRTSMFIDFARNPQWNCPIPDLNASMHSNAVGMPSSGSSQLTAPVAGTVPITSASQVDSTSVPASNSAQPLETGALDSGEPDGRGAPRDSPDSESPTATTSSTSPSTSTTTTANGDNPKGPSSAGWFIPQVVCPNDRTFYAQIGPTAGRRGYASQTGRTSWVPPVSWYINGLLVPELVVERGQTYRFIVEGGNDKTSMTRRHPLYLTDSPEGGFNFKTDSERMRERIFGGVAMRATDGQFVPTVEGRLCEWKPTNGTLQNPDLYPTFSSYQRSLKLDCLGGQAAQLKFSPDAQTPDQLYYQCYTNRYMGWRIRVVDSCGAYISAQLSQLKRQQQLASAAASSNIVAKATGSKFADSFARIKLPSLKVDKLTRRESGQLSAIFSDPHDLRPEASDSRLLSYEAPPVVGLGRFGESPVSRQAQMDEAQEFALLQAALAASNGEVGANEFGNEFAASEELAQNVKSSGLLLMNNSFLTPAQTHNRQAINLSTIEQILKLSPSDLEFLDDEQLDLLSAFALASSANPGQFLQNLQQPISALKVNNTNTNPVRQNATSSSKSLGTRMMPKSLHNYMRRLASIYQPVQQQLASMLLFQSLAPSQSHQQQQQPVQPQSQQQLQTNQQQLIASLHQQIVNAAASVPMSSNLLQTTTATTNVKVPPQPLEPSAAASSQSSTFSFANLVPTKIDLTKSNLGKRLNKLRIKTGRKYEPTTSAAAAASATSQTGASKPKNSKPPTPDNEFNYDIFNNQLMQLEERQKQLQNYEQFAAALAAANSNMDWQMAPPSMRGQTNRVQRPASFASGLQQSFVSAAPQSASLDHGGGDNFLFGSFERAPPSGHRQHFVEPLQQQQSSLNILENSLEQSPEAVFVKRLPNQNPAMYQAPPGGIDWHTQQSQQGNTQQMHIQQNRQLPNYLDSTDYNSIRQSSPMMLVPRYQMNTDSTATIATTTTTTTGQAGRQQHSSETNNAELLSVSDDTNNYKFRQQPPPGGANVESQAAGGDSDHMLAIERYSKQSSERRPPSIIDPMSGEQVVAVAVAFENEPEPGRRLTKNVTQAREMIQHQQQPPAPMRFSSKLIDKHIVEPTIGSDSYRATGEILDTEQTAQSADLRRLNGPDPGERRPPASPSTTELPQVLLKPASSMDFFTSEPPATTVAMTHSMPSTSTPRPPTSSLKPPPPPSPSDPNQELVLKTNLIDPIKSTLIPTTTSSYSYQQLPATLQLDTSPFTPIELSNNLLLSQQQRQQQQESSNNFLSFRLRPPALVESMFSQYRSPFRPEPPVRVASYLAKQLAAASTGANLNGPKSSQPITNQIPGGNQPEQTNQTASDMGDLASSRRDDQHKSQAAAGLIILKPVGSSPSQPSHTYALRPQFLTTSTSGALNSARQQEAPLVFDNQRQVPDDTQRSFQNLDSEIAPSYKLTGHQFDRLSSLSSPPSTSMVLDPLQVSTSVQTLNFHSSDQPHTQPPDRASNSSAEPLTQPLSDQRNQTQEQFPTGHQRQLSSRFDILQHDNSTDNAILSHVMSLISSNAVPTPPLIPMASAYSSADYFLPVADPVHRQHNQWRRALRTGG